MEFFVVRGYGKDVANFADRELAQKVADELNSRNSFKVFYVTTGSVRFVTEEVLDKIRERYTLLGGLDAYYLGLI